MATVKIIPALPTDTEAFALGDNEKKLLLEKMKASARVWVGLVDSEITCMFGIYASTTLNNEAYLWLLTNEIVDEHKFLFVRYSLKFIKELLKEFSTIKGHALISNIRAINWLLWLDFECIPIDDIVCSISLRRS